MKKDVWVVKKHMHLPTGQRTTELFFPGDGKVPYNAREPEPEPEPEPKALQIAGICGRVIGVSNVMYSTL